MIQLAIQDNLTYTLMCQESELGLLVMLQTVGTKQTCLKARHIKKPRVINTDEDKAYPPGIKKLKEEKLLNNNRELK